MRTIPNEFNDATAVRLGRSSGPLQIGWKLFICMLPVLFVYWTALAMFMSGYVVIRSLSKTVRSVLALDTLGHA